MLFYFLFWNCERWILLALYFSIVLIRPPVSSHTPLFHARLLIWQWAQVNRFACLCVCGVLQLLTLKTCSCSLLETFRCSTPMCAQMICVYAYLQSLHAASSACFTMLWKSVSNQFSPPSQSGGVDYWQQVVFGKKRFKKIADCFHVVPTTIWMPEVHQKHSFSPPTHSAGWTWTLISRPFVKIHMFLSFSGPQTMNQSLFP